MSKQNTADFETAQEELKRRVFATLNCIQVGQIESYDSTTQSAEIKIQVKRRVSETKSINYPILVDCPVFVLQGGTTHIDMPVQAGDYCLVLFNDRDIDTWWTSGNLKEPRTRRKHDLSDGIAIVGLNLKDSPRDHNGQKMRLVDEGNEPAAIGREGDPTLSDGATDAAFFSWVTTISAAVNALAPGSVPNVPSSMSGKINGGGFVESS